MNIKSEDHPSPSPSWSRVTANLATGAPLTLWTGNNASNVIKPYIKKPLNAFMLYKAEQRENIMKEHNIRNMAKVNEIAGVRWNMLLDVEKAPYFEQAEVAKREHQAMFPGWSNKDNYGRMKRKGNRRAPATSIQPAAPAGPIQPSFYHLAMTVPPSNYLTVSSASCVQPAAYPQEMMVPSANQLTTNTATMVPLSNQAALLQPNYWWTPQLPTQRQPQQPTQQHPQQTTYRHRS
ncbi:hypothetical protein NL108_009706 [Boleophthalmus pectinirostris]|nr:hypothetical protein NL108_009706 [Boleophthalmus pectinirostris]